MKTIKNLLSIAFLLIVAYSCEPEEIPENDNLTEAQNIKDMDGENISADTGDTDNEVDDRGDE